MDHTDASPRLSRQQARTLGLSALGGALEFYDFVIFVFFAATMGQLFFPPDMPDWLRQVQTFGIFAAGYLARPLGGIVMAHFGDRSGRKRMFMLSILLMTIPTLLMGMLLRRKLHETPVFLDLQARRALSTALPLREVLQAHRGAVVLTMFLTWLLTAAVVVTLLMMPTLLQGLGVPRNAALAGNTMAIIATILCNLLFGYVADRYGAGRTLVACSVLLGSMFWMFYAASLAGAYSPWLYMLAGAGVGLTALVPGIAVAGFPPPVRFSGLSFAYNVAYAIAGGLTPILLSLAIRDDPRAPIHYMVGMALLGIALGLFVEWRRNAPPPLASRDSANLPA